MLIWWRRALVGREWGGGSVRDGKVGGFLGFLVLSGSGFGFCRYSWVSGRMGGCKRLDAAIRLAWLDTHNWMDYDASSLYMPSFCECMSRFLYRWTVCWRRGRWKVLSNYSGYTLKMTVATYPPLLSPLPSSLLPTMPFLPLLLLPRPTHPFPRPTHQTPPSRVRRINIHNPPSSSQSHPSTKHKPHPQ